MCKNLGTFITQREKVGLITQACQPTVTGINKSSLALRFPGGPAPQRWRQQTNRWVDLCHMVF